MVLDVGFRFLPPDEELIRFFLPKKMVGDRDHTSNIGEVDLLQHEPWHLPAKSIVQSRYPEWVFFYKLNKKSTRQNDRLTQAGFWKSTGQDRNVSDGVRVVGSKKTLVFYKGRNPGGLKTDWVMHEFRVKDELIPPNADATYVVGILRNKSAEWTKTSTSNDVQPSPQSAASTSQNDAVAVSSAEVARQLQSNMDYEIALQEQRKEQEQMKDQGMFEYEVSPSFAVSGNSKNVPNMMEQEGISLDDIVLGNAFIEQEGDWLNSVFTEGAITTNSVFTEGAINSTDCSDIDIDSEWAANVMCDQDVLMSDGIGIGNGHMGGFNQRRMVNDSRQDEILIMSSVDLGTVTSRQINCLESAREEISVHSRTCRSQYDPKPLSSLVLACVNCLESALEEISVNSRTCRSQYDPKDLSSVVQACINCLESAREEISVNSRTCRSQYEPKPLSSVVQAVTSPRREPTQKTYLLGGRAPQAYKPLISTQAHPSRVQLQSTSSREAVVSRHKARKGGVHGPVVEHVQNRKSILQSNKDPKMEQDRKTNRNKKSFNSVEMSQRSCKSNSSLVCLGNVLVVLILLYWWFGT